MPATPEFFSAVRELCDETGALMMVDEVQASGSAVTELFRFGKIVVLMFLRILVMRTPHYSQY